MRKILISGALAVLSLSVSAPRATADSNGMMYHNAVANQQKTNVLGMSSMATHAHSRVQPTPHQEIEHAILSQRAVVEILFSVLNPAHQNEWVHAHYKELNDARHQASASLEALRALEKQLPAPQH